LGSLVRASSGALDIYGVVSYSSTTSIEPGRRPIARGLQEEREEDIYHNNPHLPQLLRTEFRALVVGFQDTDKRICHVLAPQPAHIHSFVHWCQALEMGSFTKELDFLPLLASADLPEADELVAAFLRHASSAHPDPEGFLLQAGRKLAALMGQDIQRLTGILRRLK
jgi:hypothetical protein